MSLWRLPPIVIIQLKRFQFTQHTRRKLRDLVVFPVEGLDLSRIVATDTSEPLEEPATVEPLKKLTRTGKSQKCKSFKGKVVTNQLKGPTGQVNSYLKDPEENGYKATQAFVSTQPITSDNGRTEMLYDLYGVVHHQGALSGGHYVASLKSEFDANWRLFNDGQIYEIHSRDVVDSSAYILFYIRRDVKGSRLSDFWDTTARDGEGLSEEDVDRLLRGQRGAGVSERCVVS
jgi:ubiquitin carboxyl-terminal hydrolase 6/32